MTLIVGIRCQDGVVLGADGIASFGTPFNQVTTIQQQTSKLSIIGNNIIMGVSGPVGLGQSFELAIQEYIKTHGNTAGWKDLQAARKFLHDAMWPHAELAWKKAALIAGTVGAQACLSSAMSSTAIAFPVGDVPVLIQFNEKCEPEHATDDLAFFALGSGQPTGEHFLAFIRRTLWPDSVPTINDGQFAVIWAINNAIATNPQGIGPPIQVVVLSKNTDGKWTARELTKEEIQIHEAMSESVLENMRKAATTTLKETKTEPIPVK